MTFRFEHEFLGRLVRGWGDDLTTLIKEAPEGFSTVLMKGKPPIVLLVPFHKYLSMYPDNEEAMWRRYRFSVFHEAMHIKFTPKDFMIGMKEVMPDLINIAEDYRIEKLGLHEFSGYTGEAEFMRVMDWTSDTERSNRFPKRRTYAESMVQKYAYPAIVTYLNQLYRQVFKGEHYNVFPKEIEEMLMRHSLQILDVEEFHEIRDFSFRTMEELRKNFQIPNQMVSFPMQGLSRVLAAMGTPTGGKKLSVTDVSSVISEKMSRPFKGIDNEDIKKILKSQKSNPIINKEFARFKEENASEKKRENKIDDLISECYGAGTEKAYWRETERSYQSLVSPHKGVIESMKAYLRKWQVGYKEVVDFTGEDIDEDMLILHNSASSGKYPIFLDEQKLASKENLFILLDMSGSICGEETEYLAVTAIVCEALDFVGCKFELAVFKGTPSDVFTKPVKLFRQRWDSQAKRRLAKLTAEGGTPMNDAFEKARKICQAMGINRIIIISDGFPSHIDGTVDEIKKIREGGLSLFMIGVGSKENLGFENLLGPSYRSNSIVVQQLSKLPNAFLAMMEGKARHIY